MHIYKYIICILALPLVLLSCRKDPADSDSNPVFYNPYWTEATHGGGMADYVTVFPDQQVNRIEIVLGSEKWNSIRNDMQTLTGSDFGSMATPEDLPSNTEPVYVEGMVTFQGKKWRNVGFRLKGNKGLSYAWNKGCYKLPFRLNFDKWEDRYPGIKNQHFYGFEELSFSPGYKDASLIREKLANDAFREAGIVSPRTAFYAVYVDIGDGLKYWGLYNMLELPEDNMIKNQFGENNGNVYKPISHLSFFNQVAFEKKNNFESLDYNDVNEFVNLLNSNLRISNYNQWKTEMESRVDIDKFLHWLAVSNAIVNQNCYGNSEGNYYLYHHSLNGFSWIPWDNNETFKGNPGVVSAPGSGQDGLSLSMNEITSNWPLVRYLIDDPAYTQIYKTHLRNFYNQQMNSGWLDTKIDAYHSLVTPYVTGPNGEQVNYTYLNNADEFLIEKNNLHSHLLNRSYYIQLFIP